MWSIYQYMYYFGLLYWHWGNSYPYSEVTLNDMGKNQSGYIHNKSQIVCIIDQFHKSHNAPVPYPTIHHNWGPFY